MKTHNFIQSGCYAFLNACSTLTRYSIRNNNVCALLNSSITQQKTDNRTFLRKYSRGIGMKASSTVLPPVIDVDCNLLHKDLLSLVSRAEDDITNEDEYSKIEALLKHKSTKESNLVGILSPSSTIEESILSIDYLKRLENLSSSLNNIKLKTTVGMHPYHVMEVDEVTEANKLKIQELASENPSIVSCIGECGLDYSEGFPPSELQRKWFQMQLDVAFDLSLPLFLHERLAFEDLLAAIDTTEKQFSKKPRPNIIIHCFTGTKAQCKEYIKRGYYMSVSGYFLKKGEGPKELAECIGENIIPLDKLMIETDAPYMGFTNCRDEFYAVEDLSNLNSKKRKRLLHGIYPNSPSSIQRVFSGVFDLINKGRKEKNEEVLSELELSKILCQNSIDFFGFDLSLEDLFKEK